MSSRFSIFRFFGVAGPLLATSTASAQTGAIRPATPAAPTSSAAPVVPSLPAMAPLAGTGAVQVAEAPINVLIVPFDSVTGILGAPRIGVLEYGQNRPYLVQPPIVQTRVLAQMTPQEREAARFRLEPDNNAAFPVRRPGAVGENIPVAGAEVPVTIPGVVPGGGVRLSDVPSEVGAATGVAAPLRRALVRSGFLDVLTAAPDGTAVRRALNERRLSQRSLDRLESAMTALANGTRTATEMPNDIKESGIAAAAQIGQALGYRSVVALAVLPPDAAAPVVAGTPASATYAVFLVDADRETGDILAFDESGTTPATNGDAAASTAAALLAKRIAMWPASTPADRALRASTYLQRARTLLAQRDTPGATEALNQSLALDASQREAQVLLGDILQSTDPLGAAAAYQRALDSGAADPGQTWEKISAAYVAAKDWPRTLDAGRRSLAYRWDTATLRLAMATAQFGRADLFRKADRVESAEEAESEARVHLDRARELSPDDPKIARLLVEQLVSQNRLREASEALDKLMAITETPDLALLTLHATTLTDRGGRDSDAFQAWARVWRQSGVSVAPMTSVRYRRIAEGFDQYVSDGARQSAQLSKGVADATLARESAVLQLQKLADDMKKAEAAIKVLQPPAGALNEANHASRQFAATTIAQAVNSHRIYVETGDDIYRSRANELHRQAITQLNIARGARTGGAQ
ncbi:MAG TPA: hypothetical protein VF681_08310 [Abditibacteriaceae bacterium]|jgi:tetratricopeptide (TPR) repeat protein